MADELKNVAIADTTANPAPLGLLGFGMTTILLNIHNAGVFPLDTMILAMGIFYGGIAQVIAGVLEWKKNNTFGTVAFVSYGFFWQVLVALILLPKIFDVPAATPYSMGFFLALWGFFTFCMFLGTFKTNRALQVIFSSLALLFALLAIKDFTGNATIGTIAGIEGIFCGASAFYAAIAQILNEMYGKTILPLGIIKK